MLFSASSRKAREAARHPARPAIERGPAKRSLSPAQSTSAPARQDFVAIQRAGDDPDREDVEDDEHECQKQRAHTRWLEDHEERDEYRGRRQRGEARPGLRGLGI